MSALGDFTADRRLVVLSAIALVLGAACTLVAALLLQLIALFTNAFYYQRLSFAAHAPADNLLGVWAIAVPVVGGLVIGLMARYGSDRIRGHGIPEAMEAILIGRSRMEPKVAVLKPLSSAISIGSGGPFGAEGPIIMTGGAVGSIVAQMLHLTASERKTLLVAGAAGGMSATFATPLAAVLLAVELLLFEWKPRSLVPVAVASSVAAALRPFVLGSGPLFPVTETTNASIVVVAACLVLGLAAGAMSSLLTRGVYAAEDAFQRLPMHWMWWPAIGGLAVGVGGLIEPRALGVGYGEIDRLVHGAMSAPEAGALMAVKAVIWIIALGSGTSGGVLAPLLIMGSALGTLATPFLPASSNLWPVVGMSALMGGTMRSPLTAVAFSLELTHDVGAILPNLVAAMAAHAFTVLLMKRSILTEKVARRGHHLTREYSVDPLEGLLVSQVMSNDVVVVPSNLPASDLESTFFDGEKPRRHQGYPVVGSDGLLDGVVTRSALIEMSRPEELAPLIVADLLDRPPIVAFGDESCRAAAERMAEFDVGRLPVVARNEPERVVGIVTRSDLLKARTHWLDQEHRRERVLRPRWRRPRGVQAS